MPSPSMGLFVPTTDVFDIGNIQKLDVNSPEFKELIIRLQFRTNQLALTLNQKDTGIYSLMQFLTSQTFYPNQALSSTTSATPIWRQVYRLVIPVPAGPNANTVTIAHGIAADATYTFVKIYGVANNSGNGNRLPLPFVSAVAVNMNIELYADNTNIYLISGSDYSAYTANVILEYFIG